VPYSTTDRWLLGYFGRSLALRWLKRFVIACGVAAVVIWTGLAFVSESRMMATPKRLAEASVALVWAGVGAIALTAWIRRRLS
jgi:hypothetical protein